MGEGDILQLQIDWCMCLKSADYSVVPVASKVKLYAKVLKKIAFGLKFKYLIASLVHTEPHLPFSFHPTFLNGYLLGKSFYLFAFLNQKISLLILCFRII